MSIITPEDCNFVRCMRGHVMWVRPGTDLDEECNKRSQIMLDALCLSGKDCPLCVLDAQREQSQMREYVAMGGCAFSSLGESCAKDCPCQEPDIPESPYYSQVGFFPEA